MSYFKSKTATEEVNIFYEDFGKGQPVILIHGWPLSHRMWEYQIEEIINAGFRCITYDRRGFGESGKPWGKYDYDTLASDLNNLIDHLNLSDSILVGFSMGGGEVARFIGNYGTNKISKAALISAVPPFMLKTSDNPEGLDKEVFEGFKKNVREDRAGFLAGFGDKFVNYSDNKEKISKDQVHLNWSIACKASPKATIDCVDSFGLTDFREDLRKFDVPALVVHGDADQIVPIDVAGKKSKDLISNAKYEVIKDAPHGLVFTHKKVFNKILIDFLKS
ncbi:alpha/beta fold hydrolase [Gillisia hiemivivida]|uniref:Alpha/beta hydrolase n=1 Tax=Gillisia hiemivivida TaxID=291190 RepID=A0A5C6ZVR1_9FLAO|nr:alpha/beta hydrolase [Gillisia hiemivivida]TXD94330.1 alpha/beta hydrolase [Gillisia hiemivivida]